MWKEILKEISEKYSPLELLSIDGVDITGKDKILEKLGSVAMRTKQFRITRCNLVDSDIEKLLSSSDGNALEGLCLYRNRLKNGAANRIGRLMLDGKFPKLTYLSLDSNNISSSCTDFLKAIENMDTLQRLHLNKNRFGNSICRALSNNSASSTRALPKLPKTQSVVILVVLVIDAVGQQPASRWKGR